MNGAPEHDRGELARLLLYNDGADDAVAIGHNIVAVDMAPLIAFAWFGEVMGAVVIDAFAAVPVVVFHVVAALPLLVTDILLLLVVFVVIVTILCDDRERSGADAEKDERGYCFFEQGFFLQRRWTIGRQVLLSVGVVKGNCGIRGWLFIAMNRQPKCGESGEECYIRHSANPHLDTRDVGHPVGGRVGQMWVPLVRSSQMWAPPGMVWYKAQHSLNRAP